MGALSVILLITFVVACLFSIFLVLLQNEEGDSIGGLFAGGSNSAFGSRSGNVLTKATYVLVTIFFVSSFVLALLNKTSSAPTQGIIREGQEIQKENAKPWYDEEKKSEDVKDESSSSTTEKGSSEEVPSDATSSSESAESGVGESTETVTDVSSADACVEVTPSDEGEASKTE